MIYVVLTIVLFNRLAIISAPLATLLIDLLFVGYTPLATLLIQPFAIGSAVSAKILLATYYTGRCQAIFRARLTMIILRRRGLLFAALGASLVFVAHSITIPFVLKIFKAIEYLCTPRALGGHAPVWSSTLRTPASGPPTASATPCIGYTRPCAVLPQPTHSPHSVLINILKLGHNSYS